MSSAQQPVVRHVVQSAALPTQWIHATLNSAQGYLAALDRHEKHHTLLANQTVVTLFQEPSTRTRASFELAAQYLGAKVFTFHTQGSSLAKGESLDDTVRTFLAMGTDALVLRHGTEGLCQDLVQQFGHRVHVLNGGEGTSDHPTQGLLDLLTLVREWGWNNLAGRTVAIVGDIWHSRVARANLALLPQFGMHVRLVGPAAFCPPSLAGPGITVHPTLESGLTGAHAVMALRIQRERLSQDLDWSVEDYIRQFQVGPSQLAQWAAPGACLLHPGPTNWGVELSPALIDHPASRIEAQVRHGVAVRMAVLAACCHPSR